MFDELANATPQIVSSSYQMRNLCPRGKIPQQFILRLFVSFECADFERGPLLTFESAILRSLLLVVSFGGVEFASAVHFLIGISPSFHTRKNSIRHP